jgi:dTDP-4-amino-4,6-dideoxygalactose transaminase
LVNEDYPLSRDALYEKLKKEGVYARRYFYPLISDFPMYRGISSAQEVNLPIASVAANKVLCLPIYPDLSDADVNRISGILSFQS